MAKEIWELWLENLERRERDFQRYLRSKKIKREGEIKELVQGHIDKADHNLKFVRLALGLKEFNDWAIVSAYYSIYHASLALCALKGYSTKDHLATLLILIKDFYQKELNREEIEMVSRITIKKEEILYYIEAKTERKKASYSTKILFDGKDAENLQGKAVGFVNRVKSILDAAEL